MSKRLDLKLTPPTEPPKTHISGGVTHGPSGTNVYAAAQTQVFQSDNKAHEVHVQGSYGQHFGGPWGKSKPSYGGGVGYKFNF